MFTSRGLNIKELIKEVNTLDRSKMANLVETWAIPKHAQGVVYLAVHEPQHWFAQLSYSEAPVQLCWWALRPKRASMTYEKF